MLLCNMNFVFIFKQNICVLSEVYSEDKCIFMWKNRFYYLLEGDDIKVESVVAIV